MADGDTMEKLYMETKAGNFPIDEKIVEKYDLEKGTFSPFTSNRIINSNGDFTKKVPPKEPVSMGESEGEVDGMENGLMLSTSEMIDLAQGVDSPDLN